MLALHSNIQSPEVNRDEVLVHLQVLIAQEADRLARDKDASDDDREIWTRAERAVLGWRATDETAGRSESVQHELAASVG